MVYIFFNKPHIYNKSLSNQFTNYIFWQRYTQLFCFIF